MSPGGKEVILPKPLAPEEYTPEFAIPEVLLEYGDGSMLLRIRHSWEQYCNGSSRSDCEGIITVPAPVGAKGSRKLYCRGCEADVVVSGIGAMRNDVLVDRANKRMQKQTVA